jgi:hypothetical protein
VPGTGSIHEKNAGKQSQRARRRQNGFREREDADAAHESALPSIGFEERRSNPLILRKYVVAI